MATEFKLPEVGEGIESGTVVGVLVSVGDTIEEDQPVLELETDKAVVEVPSSVSGTVKEIKVSENDEVSIGEVVLVIGDADEARRPQTKKPQMMIRMEPMKRRQRRSAS